MTKINGSLFVNLPNDKKIGGTYSRCHSEARKETVLQSMFERSVWGKNNFG